MCQIIRISALRSKIDESAVIGRKLPRAIPTILFLCILRKQFDLSHQPDWILAPAPQRIRLRQNRQQIAPRRLADQKEPPLRILPAHKMEGCLMITNPCADLFPRTEVSLQIPQYCPG